MRKEFLSVREIVQKTDWGIPHFQRGLVWGRDSTSRLLESLFLGTHCGTLILWKPKEPQEHGILLPNSKELTYLIVDGQQRIRSLQPVFNDDEDQSDDAIEEGDDSTSPDAGREEVWCLNLTKVKELREFFGGSEVTVGRDLALFTKVKDPRKEDAKHKHNLIPLKVILNEGKALYEWSQIHPKEKRDAILNKMKDIGLAERVCGLLEYKFPVVVLEERKGQNSLSDIVSMYNRINSSGKKVEAEERAFATLVSLWPDTNEWLKNLFASINRSGTGLESDGVAHRDTLLKRRKERNFGFKLFIRVLIQTTTYHTSRSLGSSSLSFDAIHSPIFQRHLADPQKKAEVRAIFEMSAEAILYVHRVLNDELFCDNLQFLPDTTSLIPVFQLLIRFPDIMKGPDSNNRRVVAHLILRLLLAELSPRDLIRLAAYSNSVNTAQEYIREILNKTEGRVSFKRLRERLKDSNSLQDRYVLLLYWLLRRNGIRDFSYSANLKGKNLDRKTEATICVNVQPEKAHIIPYSYLKERLGLDEGSRLSTSPANNIGNITYLSKTFNSFESGIGDNQIKLESEPRDNLRNHFLIKDSDTVNSSRILELHKIITRETKRLKLERRFNQFTTERRELIAAAFVEWVKSFAGSTPAGRRIEPSVCLLSEPLQDLIRKQDYEDRLEDLLFDIALGRSGSCRRDPKKKLGAWLKVTKSEPKGDRYWIGLTPKKVILEFRRSMDPASFFCLSGVPVDQLHSNRVSFDVSDKTSVESLCSILERLSNSHRLKPDRHESIEIAADISPQLMRQD